MEELLTGKQNVFPLLQQIFTQRERTQQPRLFTAEEPKS
jgi:hypothetical protein